MSQTPGNTIPGAGGWGSGGVHSGGNPLWLYQWGVLVGGTAIGLTAAGRLARPVLSVLSGWQLGARTVAAATRPVNWGLYNIYSEAGDIYDWSQGKPMGLQPEITARPLRLPVGYPIMIPFPWLDIKALPSDSSGGGGPGGLPNLHRPPPSIEEAGEILSNPPMVVDSKPSRKGSSSKKPKRCPKGKRWSRRLKRCVDAKLFPPGFVTVRALANEYQ